jgi:C-terminal processing protease CtpA/Prc
MIRQRVTAVLALIGLLSGCGGGSGGGGGSTASTGTTTATGNSCSLLDRQNWAFAELREWYLFPETLPASLDPAPYATVSDYIDALTATARAQHRDRFFTFLTSIAQENAFNSSGASAGFGIRLSYDTNQRRVFVNEAFEGAPALAAGIDRGTEILAIGTSAADLLTVDSIIAAEGVDGITNALGPTTAGTARLLRVTDTTNGTRDLNVTKANYSLTPVSSRYGARIINDGGRMVGYVNLRTFIDTADPALRNAFANFRAAGITNVIVDLRYNGGGLVSIAELFGDLLGGNRSTADVFDFTTFRPEKSANNSQHNFSPQAQSIAPTRIAFIGTGGTASASELVINGMLPFFRANEALVGTNTFGKPVGQIAVDRAACDDRFRIIAFATENGAHQGTYFDGLATKMDVTCQAGDDINHPMGDPLEASTRAALDFLAGRSCTAITAGAPPGAAGFAPQRPRELLMPLRPSAPQHEVPGLF